MSLKKELIYERGNTVIDGNRDKTREDAQRSCPTRTLEPAPRDALPEPLDAVTLPVEAKVSKGKSIFARQK